LQRRVVAGEQAARVERLHGQAYLLAAGPGPALGDHQPHQGEREAGARDEDAERQRGPHAAVLRRISQPAIRAASALTRKTPAALISPSPRSNRMAHTAPISETMARPAAAPCRSALARASRPADSASQTMRCGRPSKAPPSKPAITKKPSAPRTHHPNSGPATAPAASRFQRTAAAAAAKAAAVSSRPVSVGGPSRISPRSAPTTSPSPATWASGAERHFQANATP